MVFKEAYAPPTNAPQTDLLVRNTDLMPHVGILDQLIFKKVMINYAKVSFERLKF